MSPPFWTTPAERAFLEPWMPVYLTLKAEGKIHLFGPQLYEAWFKEHPEHRALGLPLPNARDGRALTQDELANLAAAIQAKKAKRNTDTIREKLAEEGYNELNKEKMADDVDDWENEAESTAAARKKCTKAERMRVRTRVVQALWAEASTEERAAVEAEVEREKEEIREEELAAERQAEENPDERTPRQYQDGIDVLEPFLGEAHKAIKDEAGWVGLTITGGPNPRLNGGLSYKIVSFGVTPAGHDFEDYCDNFDKNVAEPFEAFLRARFSVAERQARALPKPDDDTDEPRLPREHGGDVANDAPPPKAKKPKRMVKAKKKTASAAAPTPVAPAATPTEATASVASSPAPPPPTSSLPVSPAVSESESGDSGNILSKVCDYANDGLAYDADDSNPLGEDDGDTYLSGGDLAPVSDVRAPPSLDFGLWPAGMGAPSSPGTAAAQAMRERGGMPGGATMAIDPRLLGVLSSPPSPSPLAPTPMPPRRPVPRPTYAGSIFGKPNTLDTVDPPSTTNIRGFNFPTEMTIPTVGSYKPSVLFEAFRGSSRGSEVPLARTPIHTPIRTPTYSTGARAASTTKSAEVLAGIIGAPSPGPSIFGASRPIALPSTMGPITGMKRFSLPSIAANPNASPPNPTALSITQSTDNDAPRAVVLPDSRPAMRPPKEKTAPTARKAPAAKGGKKAAAGKKATVAKVGKKEAAAASAQKTAELVKRGRGRPRKEAGGGESSGGAVQLADVTNAPAVPPPLVSCTAANAPPAFVSTLGHETRDFNRAVDQRPAKEVAARAAQQEKEDAQALAEQVERGWITAPNPAGGCPLVITTRVRKSKTFADGSAPVMPVKKTRPRAVALSATEATLLARSAALKKRKAPPAGTTQCKGKKPKNA
ncbi:hypothetical protein B0H13DRAFT_2451277 [Mycena leptocephala]|nr:hypothetical protein B0H13DRAFT_2451277 [Mycena leptocephala]